MKIFWILFLALLFLHQDFWNWSSEEMVLGGVPIGLFYHALFSLACSGLGAWAVLRAWPSDWEQYAEDEGKQREQGMKTDLQDR
jgi:hypothetical protein